jgi:3-oxoacyl-[acyl-carrier protein] reductase
MDLQLRGLKALVTGSSSGIGAGIATTLAAEGAIVIVHGRDRARTRAVAEQLAASGATTHVVFGDLATPGGCDSVAAAVNSEVGGVDILVNNAGGKTAPGNPAWFEVGWNDWLGTFEQNVGAAVRLAHAFVPGMKARGFGRIINVTSASATQPEGNIGEYQAAKAAMVNLTASLARALAHTGVTVNSVMPGTILTPAVERWLSHVAQQRGWGTDWTEIERRFTTEMIPLCTGKLGRPEDIGRMVALLASPLSSYMTGSNYRVDGGQVRSIV